MSSIVVIESIMPAKDALFPLSDCSIKLRTSKALRKRFDNNIESCVES